MGGSIARYLCNPKSAIRKLKSEISLKDSRKSRIPDNISAVQRSDGFF